MTAPSRVTDYVYTAKEVDRAALVVAAAAMAVAPTAGHAQREMILGHLESAASAVRWICQSKQGVNHSMPEPELVALGSAIARKVMESTS